MKHAYRTKPGELEIRIGRNGRVCVLAADEAMMDVLDALDPDAPASRLRRKAKARAQSRTDTTRRAPGAGRRKTPAD